MKTFLSYLASLFIFLSFTACSADEIAPDLSTEGLLKGSWTQTSMVYQPYIDGEEMKYSSAKANIRATFDGSKYEVDGHSRDYLISTEDEKGFITIKDWKGKDAIFEITRLNKYSMSWHRDVSYIVDGKTHREVETGEFKRVF